MADVEPIQPQPDWTVGEARERLTEYRDGLPDTIDCHREYIGFVNLLGVSLALEDEDDTLEDVIRRLCSDGPRSVVGGCNCPRCGALCERMFGIKYCYDCDDVFVEDGGD